jgi:hypothetical protein
VLRQERIASAPSTIGDYRRRVCVLSNAKVCVISVVCNLRKIDQINSFVKSGESTFIDVALLAKRMTIYKLSIMRQEGGRTVQDKEWSVREGGY